MKKTICHKEYNLLVGYQEDSIHRDALNNLANSIFGLSFETWYQSGYWQDRYIPYTLFDGEKAVANISVNIMEFNILGKKKRVIQLGTGMTDKSYRNQPLYPFLGKYVLNEWAARCDFIYFYANNNALSKLYPKMGFVPVKEYEYYKTIVGHTNLNKYQKLDMSLKMNRDMLYDYAKHSVAFAKLAMQENADLVLFYCTMPLTDNVFYIASLDVIAIATISQHQLHLLDVFGPKEVELDKIITTLANKDMKEILLGFTPNDAHGYQSKEIKGDETLFIPKKHAPLFTNHRLMFPALSHA